jgi:hypothetical protein
MKYCAMEYKGLKYQIVQTAVGWRWTVFLDVNSTRSGISRNRSVAILDALRAIQKSQKDARKALRNVRP